MTTHPFAPRTEVGPLFNEGARLLWLALKARDMSQGALCRVIGLKKTGPQNKWLWGVHRPDYPWRKKILAEFGISIDAWDEEPSEAFAPSEWASAESADALSPSAIAPTPAA